MSPSERVYKRVGEHALTLRVFPPSAARRLRPRPAVVFFFGGGFVGGRIEQFEPHCRYLASRGMVAMVADYRVRDRHGSGPPDSVADGRSAVLWIRAHAAELGVDPARIAAGGGSAGGGVAACAGLMQEEPPAGEPATSSRPDALVLFNPVLVAAPVDGRELRPPERVAVYAERWGRGDIPEVSAYHHVTSSAPPTLILHGEADAICPLATVEPFVARMREHGVRCELVTYPGQPHGFFNYGRGSNRFFRATLEEADSFLASLGFLEGTPGVDAWLAEFAGS